MKRVLFHGLLSLTLFIVEEKAETHLTVLFIIIIISDEMLGGCVFILNHFFRICL